MRVQVRCSRLLYTLCVEDNDKADKLKQSLPPGERPLPTIAFGLFPSRAGTVLQRSAKTAVVSRGIGSGQPVPHSSTSPSTGTSPRHQQRSKRGGSSNRLTAGDHGTAAKAAAVVAAPFSTLRPTASRVHTVVTAAASEPASSAAEQLTVLQQASALQAEAGGDASLLCVTPCCFLCLQASRCRRSERTPC